VLNDARNSVGLTSVTAAYDYYPFGMIAKSYSPTAYRYGFNGMEKDDEIAGSGNSYTAEFWQYDSRLGRRWNVDPVTYPWQSPYATFNNNPIIYVDPLGLEGEKPNLFQRFKAGIGIGKISGTRIAGNQRYRKNRNWTPPAPTAKMDTPSDNAPSDDAPTSRSGGGVRAGETKDYTNPRSPINPDGIQFRPDLEMQIFQLPGMFINNSSSGFNANANTGFAQIGALYNQLSQVVNRDAFNVEALEVHIYVGINIAMVSARYTLRSGTVLAVATAQQILDDRAATMRAALIRVGIPNDKIKWNSSTMGGVSGRRFTIPATKTGRHPGNTFTFPEDPANTHGVIFR
jgi:RHS repeat-associated protein